MRLNSTMRLRGLVLITLLVVLQSVTFSAEAVKKEDGVFTVDLYRSDVIGTAKVSGLAVETVFPKLALRDYDGKKFDLQNIDQRMLICYEHVFAETNVKNAFYQAVAQKWAGKLKVVVLYQSKPSKEYAARLKEAGVIVIPNFGLAEKYLFQNHVPLVYLVDEKKIVRYSYKFTLNDWKDLQTAVDLFAETGRIPENRGSFKPVLIGSQFTPGSELKDIEGKPVTLKQGKVTLLFFEPYPEAIPALEVLRTKYQDEINILVIFRYWSQEKIQEVLDYYSVFKLKSEPGDGNPWALDYEGIKPYIEPFKKSSFVCIANQDGSLFNLFNVFNSNMAMVLDKEGRLVGGLVAAYAFYDNKEDAKNAPLLENELIRLIEKSFGR